MRELSRALALDPTDRSAFALIMQVVGASTEDLPPKAEAELKAVELHDRQRNIARAARTYLSWVLAMPELAWMGVKSWVALAVAGTLLAVGSFGAWFQGKTGRVAPRHMRIGLFVNFIGVAATSTLFGPFVFTPALAAASAASFVVAIRANRETRGLVFSLSFLAVFIPYVLQSAGVIPPSYVFEDGVIKILPVLVHFPPLPTQILLVGATAVQLILPGFLISRAVEALISAERRNFAQAFRLRQLLPAGPEDESDQL